MAPIHNEDSFTVKRKHPGGRTTTGVNLFGLRAMLSDLAALELIKSISR